MAVELSLETLPQMKIAEFVKAFKNRTSWKKATYVLLLMDYRLDGKKVTVAMPFKKPIDAIKAFKKVKEDKIHLLKKVGLGSFSLEKVGDKVQANIEISKGGLSAEAVFTKAAKLFDRIKLGLNFIGMEGSPLEDEAADEMEDENEATTEAIADEEEMGEAETTATTEPATASPQQQAAALKATFEQISADLNVFKTKVIPNVQARNVGAEDLAITSDLDKAITSFAEAVAETDVRVQEKFKPILEKLLQHQAKLKQILERFGNQENNSTAETTEMLGTRTIEETQQRLNEIKNRIAEIRSTHFA